MPLWGGIEAGGTKIVCAIGAGPQDLCAKVSIPTTTPEQNFAEIIQFFRQHPEYPIEALGIASFGPIDPNPQSSTFGHILETPKFHWSQVDFVGAMRQHLAVPIGFDTDVNGAALGEHCWGAAQGLDTFLYLTVGTGLGGGGMMNGKLMHGLLHPEMGHMLLPHNLDQDPFGGACPFHQDCLEGLASGVAIEQRWGQKGNRLPPDHPAWVLEAHYLALGLVNLILICSPQRIILGGGVMDQTQLFPLIRTKVQASLKSYVKMPAILNTIETYIVPPHLGNQAGILGAIALAERTYRLGQSAHDKQP